MRNVWWTFIGIIVVFVVAVYICLPSTQTFIGRSVQVSKGIDIAGGARLLMCAQAGTHPTDAEMNTARDVINSRASGGYGVTEPQVTRVGNNCISVELPGLKDKNQSAVIRSIGQTGYLAITDSAS